MYKVSIHKDPNDSEDFEMLIEDPNILPDQELHEKLSLEQPRERDREGEGTRSKMPYFTHTRSRANLYK